MNLQNGWEEAPWLMGGAESQAMDLHVFSAGSLALGVVGLLAFRACKTAYASLEVDSSLHSADVGAITLLLDRLPEIDSALKSPACSKPGQLSRGELRALLGDGEREVAMALKILDLDGDGVLKHEELFQSPSEAKEAKK